MAELTSVPTQIDFAMVSGDTKTLTIECVKPNRTPYSLANVVRVDYQIAKSVNNSAIVTKTLQDDQTAIRDEDIDAVTHWYVDIDLDPEDTDALSGDYYHECQIKTDDGVISTIFSGTLTIKKDLVQ